MTKILLSLFFFLFFFGIFLIVLDIKRIPTRKAYKSTLNLIRKEGKGTLKVNFLLDKLSLFISKKIKLSEIRREELESELYAGNFNITPEFFIARRIVKASLPFLILLPLGFFVNYLFFIFGIALSFLFYLLDVLKLKKEQEKKREEIEKDLPNFVNHITKLLPKGKPDIIFYCESFLEYAGETFRNELKITIADMRSGSIGNALLRLEKRCNSNTLSEVLRGFMSILRGDISIVFWENELLKMSELRRQKARFQAMKIPKKVNKLSLILYICFILIWGYVLFTLITESVTILF